MPHSCVFSLSAPFLPSPCLQQNAKLKQQQQSQSAGKQLDVLSLAHLQQRNVPITDDSPKYDYKRGQDGKYGKDQPFLVKAGLTLFSSREINVFDRVE